MVLHRVSHANGEMLLWFHAKGLGKKFIDFVALVSLELKHFAQFFTSDNGSVACEILCSVSTIQKML